MACACSKRSKIKYVWTPPQGSSDGEGTIVYNSEIVAKAKVKREGGSYVPVGRN